MEDIYQIRNVKYEFFLMTRLMILMITELIIRGRKIKNITQSCFPVPKNFRINSTYYFLMKIEIK